MRHRACAVLFAMAAGAVHAQFETAPSPAQPDNVFDRAVAHPKRDNAAQGILDGGAYAQQRAPLADADAGRGVLQTGDLTSWPRLYRDRLAEWRSRPLQDDGEPFRPAARAGPCRVQGESRMGRILH